MKRMNEYYTEEMYQETQSKIREEEERKKQEQEKTNQEEKEEKIKKDAAAKRTTILKITISFVIFIIGGALTTKLYLRSCKTYFGGK